MSDINFDKSAFVELLATRPHQGGTLSLYHDQVTNTEAKRTIAVRCALELIRTKASSSTTMSIEGELESLGKYADMIQNALKLDE